MYLHLGVLYCEGVRQGAIDDENFENVLEGEYPKAIRIMSLADGWQQRVWIPDVGYITENINVQMTLRKEKRSGTVYWYAYRRVHSTLYKRYVGRSEDINTRKIVEVARRMPG